MQVRHRKKYKVTTNSNHKQPVFENRLNRQFDVANPNQYKAEAAKMKKAALTGCPEFVDHVNMTFNNLIGESYEILRI